MLAESMNQKPQHATITLERSYRAPLERAFSEFPDPVARARWSPTSDDVLVFSNFREPSKPAELTIVDW
jgi:uncharacterized protein YndB with AHSA1/START domain